MHNSSRSTRFLAYIILPTLLSVGCGDENGKPVLGKSEIYVEVLLNVTQLTYLRGRCLARASITAVDDPAKTALMAFARHVIDPIPLDASSPANDQQLVALIPTQPAGAFAVWTEDLSDSISGPWLITTDAFDWINGAGGPFEDNGFEAAAGEKYNHNTESWTFDLDLVNMSSTSGAEAAFVESGWNAGTKQ